MARELHIRQLSGTGKNREITVRDFPLLIGRSEDCHLRFDPQDETKVSALHAEIRLDDRGTFQVFDLESRNGTFLNGDRVAEPQTLPERSILEVGQGGPRIDMIIREGGSGVSFTDIRRKTGSEDPLADKPLAETDDAIVAYQDPEPPIKGVSDRIKPKPQSAMFIMIAIVSAILLGALIYFM